MNDITEASWRYHPAFSDMKISSEGHIMRKKRGVWGYLNQYENGRGYLRVNSSRGASQCVHSLVAETFVDNPDPINKRYINHKDGNKHNNKAGNLEWVTASENQRHAYTNDLRRPNYIQNKNVAVKILETGEAFTSMSECARRIGGRVSKICECLRGTRPHHLGYHFERVCEEDSE